MQVALRQVTGRYDPGPRLQGSSGKERRATTSRIMGFATILPKRTDTGRTGRSQ